MSILESLYRVLNQFNSLIIEFRTDSFYFLTGVRDKLSFNGKEITGKHITIKDVKSFTVGQESEDAEVPEEKYIIITFENCSTVKICCI